jgi:flavodoxin
MKPCVYYISRTGNTKRLAEAISELLKAPMFNIAEKPDPSTALDFDLLIIGTPVMGMKPTPEVSNFIKLLPNGQNKKAILFCTYAIRQGGTLKHLEKYLRDKNYQTILSVSKRGLKPGKSDFGEILDSISQAVKVE